MSLREQAAQDAQAFLEDAVGGFGVAITVTLPDPEADPVAMTGFSTDIHATIDPETGQAVSGERASVALSLRSLEEAGIGLPRAVVETNKRPWLVTFADVAGESRTFNIVDVMPDRAMGVVVCLLEAYRQSG